MGERRGTRRVDRRAFLKVMGGVVAVGSAGLWLRARPTDAQVSLAPFVDALPIPRVIGPGPGGGPYGGPPPFIVTMKALKQKLHRDLPPTPLWGYNGQYPGPT